MEQDETEVLVFETLMQWFSTFCSPWTIFMWKYLIKDFSMLTPHEQQVENILHKGHPGTY